MIGSIIKEDLEFIADSKLVDWERFRRRTVLISGASGMLPSYMVETLLFLNEKAGLDIKVVALVRNLEKARKVFSSFEGDPKLEFIVQDVTQPIHYPDSVDYMIHAASQAAPSYYGVDPVGTFMANTAGTVNMLELAREKAVKGFLYFSTGSVYGDVQGDEVFLDEGVTGIVNPLDVRNCYAEGKRAGENACVCYHYQYGVPVKIVRIFHTFGPNVNLDDGRVFSDFCKNVLQNQDIVLKSEGTAKRVFCYVADAVLAYFLVLLEGSPAAAYNVGGDREHEISVRDLAFLLSGLFPDRGLKVVFDINPDDLTYVRMQTPQQRILADLSRIRSLGWKQHFSVRDCFERTIRSIEEERFMK